MSGEVKSSTAITKETLDEIYALLQTEEQKACFVELCKIVEGVLVSSVVLEGGGSEEEGEIYRALIDFMLQPDSWKIQVIDSCG